MELVYLNHLAGYSALSIAVTSIAISPEPATPADVHHYQAVVAVRSMAA